MVLMTFCHVADDCDSTRVPNRIGILTSCDNYIGLTVVRTALMKCRIRLWCQSMRSFLKWGCKVLCFMTAIHSAIFS